MTRYIEKNSDQKWREEDHWVWLGPHPIYTWPNPDFPFLCLSKSKEARIFFISNLTHNYRWLKDYAKSFRESDLFFVSCGWNFSKYIARQADAMFDALELNRSQFFVLYNSPEELANGARFGFRGEVINNNCWLEENDFSIQELPKKYDAFYLARAVEFKRHYLAAKIKRLALAAGDKTWTENVVELPKCLNNPHEFLNKEEISILCGSSNCGLILSPEEGACRASSEYLMSGTPVVSTKSSGGRDVWYNSENSIICEDSEDAVKDAVEEACSRKWDREKIRLMHIEQAIKYRNKFKEIIEESLNKIGCQNLSAEQVLCENNYLKHWEQHDFTIHENRLEQYFEK